MNIPKMMIAFKCLKGASRRYNEGERSDTPLSAEDDAYFRIIRDRLRIEKQSPAALRRLLLE